MKKMMLVFCTLAMIFGLSACSGAFWGGTATGTGAGTIATGGAYELNAQKQLSRIKSDLDGGKINQSEYDIRKDQIKRMSIFA